MYCCLNYKSCFCPTTVSSLVLGENYISWTNKNFNISSWTKSVVSVNSKYIPCHSNKHLQWPKQHDHYPDQTHAIKKHAYGDPFLFLYKSQILQCTYCVFLIYGVSMQHCFVLSHNLVLPFWSTVLGLFPHHLSSMTPEPTLRVSSKVPSLPHLWTKLQPERIEKRCINNLKKKN